jgi:hypothetical protein
MPVVTQKKGTLWRNPRKSGGSPRGVREPPMFATRKMKKQITWALWIRSRLARSTGRIMIMAAPVVPTQEARNVPMRRRIVFTRGVPRREPCTTMPPEMVNSPQRRMMKGM